MDRADVKPLLALLLPVFLFAACDFRNNEARAGDIPGELRTGLTAQWEEPLPGALARRLGDAADGFRTGLPIWIVADPRYPHDVQGVYGSEESAEVARRRFEPEYRIYGPFRTEIDFALSTAPFVVECKRHDSTWCERPDTVAVARDLVRTISISIILEDGTRRLYEFDPDSVEAVFFSVSAIDRLVIPYYTRLKGLDWTSEFRGSLRAGVERSFR